MAACHGALRRARLDLVGQLVVSVVYVGVVVAKGVTMLWASSRLPERPATHFGASGRADGWMRRRTLR